jgi:hypothetical protein
MQQLVCQEFTAEQPIGRAGGTVHQDRRHGQSITYKIITAGSLSSSQPGGPPCWTSPLAFGLMDGTAAKVLFCSSIAVCLKISNLDPECFKGDQILAPCHKILLIPMQFVEV